VNKTETLECWESPLRTSMGGCFPGERAVFRGHDLHAELRDADWLDLYLFGICGRRHTPAQIRVLHAIWVNTSYPDPRLWNNRVAALAGSARSTGILAISAALATSEAAIYGRQIDIAIADFLVRAKAAVKAGRPLTDVVAEELRASRGIGGYGRPVAKSAADERNAVVLALAENEGLAGGEYVKLAFAIEEILLTGRWRMRMNYAAIAAALALDIGLAPREYYLYMLPAFLAGMPPCYIEACERPEQTTFPLRCQALIYHGPARRAWARHVG
jgi:citrate synthase